MDNMYVNEKTLVGEVVSAYPETAEVLSESVCTASAVLHPRRNPLRTPLPSTEWTAKWSWTQ